MADPIAFHRLIGGSVQGESHVQDNLPCQDAYAYSLLSPDTIAVAVADGVGSVARPDVGAKLAVTAAIDYAGIAFTKLAGKTPDLPGIVKEMATGARAALEARSAADQCDLDDLATTLLIAILTKDRVCSGHIGDGAIVAETAEGIEMLSPPGESEYANVVVPLTYSQWEEEFRVFERANVSGIAVFTDGCQNASLTRSAEGYKPHPGFFIPIFKFTREREDTTTAEQDLAVFLSSERMKATSHDDKTLVIAVWGEPVN